MSPARALVGPQDRFPFGAYLDPFHHVGDKNTPGGIFSKDKKYGKLIYETRIADN